MSISYQKDPKVLLIGIDGLLQTCLNEADHSIFDFLIKTGSYTFNARTAIETISGSGWSNILCGMPTEDSGITGNSWIPTDFFLKINRITPILGSDKPLPCIFKQIKDSKPELINFSIYNWDWFIFLGNNVCPNNLDQEFYFPFEYSMKDMDMKIINKALELIKKDFNLFFLYFGTVDEYGHDFNFCGKEYIEQLSVVNKYIEILFDEIKNLGMMDDIYILLVTDHGASYMKDSHGNQDDSNLIVPMFIKGPGIRQNYEIKDNVKNIDVTPTIMKILGIDNNEFWRGKSIDEIFINNKSK